jgi:hypothetical protein
MPRMRSDQFNGAYDLPAMLAEVEARSRVELTTAESRNRLLGLYVRPLADRVLRHATLGWVADWAESSGRSFHLYGLGWENHPRLSKFARGVARHGAHLGAIARSAAINLHFGLNLAMHQRVLETTAAGGFLLVRYHPQDFFPPWMSTLFELAQAGGWRPPAEVPLSDLPPEVADKVRQRRVLLGRPASEFISISQKLLNEGDPARPEARRQWFASETFPMLDAITFKDPGAFAARAEHFLAHPKQRAQIVRDMRAIVQREYTYDALVASMTTFVRDRLAASARSSR